MISNPLNSICPFTTLLAPNANAAAAPMVIEQSVIPLESTLVPRTHMVFLNKSRAFTSKESARFELCPNAFKVARP